MNSMKWILPVVLLVCLVGFLLYLQPKTEIAVKEALPRTVAKTVEASATQPNSIAMESKDSVASSVTENQQKNNTKESPESAAHVPTNTNNTSDQHLALHLQDVLQNTLLIGMDPKAVADAVLPLLDKIDPIPSTRVPAPMPNAIAYTFADLPTGMKGYLFEQKSILHTERSFYAILAVPYQEPIWLENWPRSLTRIAVTMVYSQEGEMLGYGFSVELPVDGDVARQYGLEPSLADFPKGVMYGNKIKEDEFEVSALQGSKIGPLNPSLMVGNPKLDEATLNKIHQNFQRWIHVIKPEEVE